MRNLYKLPGASLLTRGFLLVLVGISVSMPLVGCGGSKPAENNATATQKAGPEKDAAILKETQDEKNPDKK